MKKILIVILVLSCALPVQAKQATQREIAVELLDVIGVTDSIRQMSDQVYDLSLKPVSEQLACKDPRIATALKKGMKNLKMFEKLQEEFTDLYVSAFTREELVQILAFNKTPLGQKVIKVTPDILAKGAKVGQDFVASKEPALLELFNIVASKYLTPTGQCKTKQKKMLSR